MLSGNRHTYMSMMEMWKVSLIACFICFAYVNASGSDRTYHILEGDNLLVRCNATEGPDIHVYWLRNDTKKFYRQNGTDLTIVDIKRDFSGEYVCHMVNSTNPDNVSDSNVTTAKVDVMYPAEIQSFNLAPTVVPENGSFTITFSIKGNPAPYWEIRNNDTMESPVSGHIEGEGSVGPIKARCESAGYWMCTGYNNLNEHGNVTAGQVLIVNCPPKPADNQKYEVRSLLKGSASLVMNIYTIPRPTYTWTKDGERTRGIQTDNDKYTRLDINNLQIRDFGTYLLTMSNEYGTYVAEYDLRAEGSPQTPTNTYFSDVTSTSVRLHWTSGYDMGSPQHFEMTRFNGRNAFVTLGPYIYDNSTTHGVGISWSHELTSLMSDTEYNMSILAVNEDQYVSHVPKPFMVFKTLKGPDDIPGISYSMSTGAVVGVSFGSLLGFLAFLALLLYVFKWRKMRVSYDKC